MIYSKNQQDKYKQSIQELEVSLKKAISSVRATDEMLLDMIESYLKINTTSIKLNEVIGTGDNQINNLKILLKTLSEVGKKAKASVEEIDDFSVAIQNSIVTQPKVFNELTGTLEKQLPKSLGELNKTLSIQTNKFQRDYEVFLEQILKLMLKYEQTKN